ncbi:hypothetical protein EB001_18455 [bacterium]|nr:hypothetical protein [bacterium]
MPLTRIQSLGITDGTIVNADINASAAIASTKLSGVVSGLTAADQWRLTTNFSVSSGTTSDITSNWEQNDSTGFTVLGSSMTQSSGIFTFPSTGYWLINYIMNPISSSTDDYVGGYISITTDNSTYTDVTETYGNQRAVNADTIVISSFIFDVTSTTNCKVKFKGRAGNTTENFQGNTTKNRTHVTFIRLGDT